MLHLMYNGRIYIHHIIGTIWFFLHTSPIPLGRPAGPDPHVGNIFCISAADTLLVQHQRHQYLVIGSILKPLITQHWCRISGASDKLSQPQYQGRRWGWFVRKNAKKSLSTVPLMTSSGRYSNINSLLEFLFFSQMVPSHLCLANVGP